jgi:hypothetical protein
MPPKSDGEQLAEQIVEQISELGGNITECCNDLSVY